MMNVRRKILFGFVVASFPVMLSFQNCAKNQDFQATDIGVDANKSVAAPVDSETLPLNEEVAVDETNNQVKPPADDSSSDSHDVRYQVEDPALEHERDIQEALAACSALNFKESKNKTSAVSLDEASNRYSVEGLRGSKVLSPDDFEGQSDIRSISNSYGKIVLCGLNVDEIFKTGGKIIAVGSHIRKVTSHYGSIDLLNGSAVIDASNVKIYRSEM